jgi:hypothetical protein
MRRCIAQKGLSYVTLVAGIGVGGSFDEAPDRAFRALAGFIDGASRSRRQIAVTAPVIQQNTDLEHPEKIAMTAPVVQQTAGRPGWRRPVGFDFGNPQLEHGHNPDRSCRVGPWRRRRRWARRDADRLRCDHHEQVLNELSRPAPTRCRRARR